MPVTSKIIPFSEYPVRPRRKSGESLAGYLYRHLSANGYGVGQKHWEVLAHYYDQDRRGNCLFDAGQKELLEFLAWLDKDWILGLQKLSHPTFKAWLKPKVKVVRFCPACVKRVGIHHQLWEHPLVNACGYHGCQLLANCPECGFDFQWNKLSGGWVCRCHKPIAEMITQKARPYDVAVARYLTNAWDGDEDGKPKGASQKRLIHACLELEVACQVARYLSPKRSLFVIDLFSARISYVSHPIMGWVVRMMDADKEMLGKRLCSLLRRRLWRKGRVLDRVQKITLLSNAWDFIERRPNCLCKAKLLNVVKAVVEDHHCELPLNGTVLFNPLWSRTEFGYFLKNFGHWWRRLAEGMGILDETVQAAWNVGLCNDVVTEARDVKVFEILQTLTQLACDKNGINSLLVLRHWWRIPNSLQKPEPLRDTLHQVCAHLCMIHLTELAMVHAMVTLTEPQ